jgi:hypothetical protein
MGAEKQTALGFPITHFNPASGSVLFSMSQNRVLWNLTRVPGKIQEFMEKYGGDATPSETVYTSIVLNAGTDNAAIFG